MRSRSTCARGAGKVRVRPTVRERISRFDREYKRSIARLDHEYKHESTAPGSRVQVSSKQIVLVLTTLGTSADVDGFARTLVEERLAACVNVLPPMQSTYRWKGMVEQDTERQVVIKTAADRVGALRARVRELHTYDLPEFVVLVVTDGDRGYLDWVLESVAGPDA